MVAEVVALGLMFIGLISTVFASYPNQRNMYGPMPPP